MLFSVRVINEKEQERQARENRGVNSSDVSGVWRAGLTLSTFLFGSGAFLCILVACFNVSIRCVKVKTESKSSFMCQLVSYLTWRMYHP